VQLRVNNRKRGAVDTPIKLIPNFGKKKSTILQILENSKRIILSRNGFQLLDILSRIRGQRTLISRSIIHIDEWNPQATLGAQLFPRFRGIYRCAPNYIVILCVCPVNQSRPPCTCQLRSYEYGSSTCIVVRWALGPAHSRHLHYQYQQRSWECVAVQKSCLHQWSRAR
jgi:hypothetical protein